MVDTREQLPLDFSDRVVTERRALPAGDYSVAGAEARIAVERKALDDFVSSVIRDRPRFLRELDKLRSYQAACVVVEAGLPEILDGQYRSGVHPNAVLGAAIAIVVDYGIPVVFCGDRFAASRFTEAFLLRAYRKVTCECPNS